MHADTDAGRLGSVLLRRGDAITPDWSRSSAARLKLATRMPVTIRPTTLLLQLTVGRVNAVTLDHRSRRSLAKEGVAAIDKKLTHLPLATRGLDRGRASRRSPRGSSPGGAR